MTEFILAPLIPADVDLRGFQFLPLDVNRFRDSTLVAKRSGDEVVAAVLLWSASWHQQPAASLPDDDAELARLAGFGRAVKEFKRISAGAMHGLVLCSDGRWYHPVVAEKAADAWNGKLTEAWRRSADRVRKENKDRTEAKQELLPLPHKPALLIQRNQGDVPTFVYAVSAGIPAEGPRNSRSKGKGDGKREGQGQGKGDSGKTLPAAAGPSIPTWEAYADAYEHRYSVPPVRNAKVNGMLARFVERVGADDAPAVARWFLSSNRGLYVSAKHAVDLLLRDAEGLRTDWATGNHGTETQARLADRAQATGNVFGKLIAEAEAHGD